MLRVLGVADVPWYPERDEADEATLPEEEEWLIEPSDTESEIDTEQRPNQRTTAWPSNRGLPPSSEWTPTITENQPAQQLTLTSPLDGVEKSCCQEIRIRVREINLRLHYLRAAYKLIFGT